MCVKRPLLTLKSYLYAMMLDIDGIYGMEETPNVEAVLTAREVNIKIHTYKSTSS